MNIVEAASRGPYEAGEDIEKGSFIHIGGDRLVYKVEEKKVEVTRSGLDSAFRVALKHNVFESTSHYNVIKAILEKELGLE